MPLVDTISAGCLLSLFRNPAAVSNNWPLVQAELTRRGLGDNEVVLAYAIGTIYAETGNFVPRDEAVTAYNSPSAGRPFGRYDQPLLTKDGHMRPLTDKKGKPLKDTWGKPAYNRIGNRPDPTGTAEEKQRNFDRALWQLARSPPQPTIANPLGSDESAVSPRNIANVLGYQDTFRKPDPLPDYHDGERYKGRGFIQLTGRDNYHMASNAIGIDLVEHPTRANEPDIAAKLVGWFLTKQNGVKRIESSLSNGSRSFANFKAARTVVNAAGWGTDDLKKGFEYVEGIFMIHGAIHRPSYLPMA